MDQDLEALGLPAGANPRIGQDVLCLAVLCLRETGTTANLLAPVVVNLKNYRAVQAVSPESKYSHRHPLFAPDEALC
jgi:flagellar assembly factor FliW